MKYTVYINGYGAEVTQGELPAETVETINAGIIDSESDLETYLVQGQFSEDVLDWYEVDSNFHSTGAYLDESTIYVEDESGNIVWSEECCNLETNFNYTQEIYPGENISDEVSVLTCLDIQKGTFTTGTISTESFNSDLIKLEVNSLGDIDIISSIKYNDVEIDDLDFGDTTSKNFKAILEE
jgi:hypothetical protein